MGERVYVALGSNVGDREAHLAHARARLGALPRTRLIRASRVEETPPLGPVPQGPFLNQMVLLETELPPTQLLGELHAIEAERGRERKVRWGPRTLDIDLIAYDDLALDTPDLMLPHPRLFERAFVLVPLAEIAPERTIAGIRVRDALAKVDITGIHKLPPR